MKRILKTNFLKLDQQKQTQMKINQLTKSQHNTFPLWSMYLANSGDPDCRVPDQSDTGSNQAV